MDKVILPFPSYKIWTQITNAVMKLYRYTGESPARILCSPQEEILPGEYYFGIGPKITVSHSLDVPKGSFYIQLEDK